MWGRRWEKPEDTPCVKKNRGRTREIWMKKIERGWVMKPPWASGYRKEQISTAIPVTSGHGNSVRSSLFRRAADVLYDIRAHQNFSSKRKMCLTSRHHPMLSAISTVSLSLSPSRFPPDPKQMIHFWTSPMQEPYETEFDELFLYRAATSFI